MACRGRSRLVAVVGQLSTRCLQACLASRQSDLCGAHLWVNHEGPSAGLAHHDGVVDGGGVVGQAIDDPVSCLDGVAHHPRQCELLGAWILSGAHLWSGTRDLLLIEPDRSSLDARC